MMDGNALNIIIVLLFFIMLGMVVALIVIPIYEYHGPNSNNINKNIYHYNKNGKCYNFGVQPLNCPKKFFG